jgi:hypothetical protein
MYGFENIDKNVLTVENILELVPEVILWRYYTGVNFTLNKPFCATYRIDNNPSFSIRENKYTGRLSGVDWARDWHGDIFNYLEMVYSISFYYTLIKINIDFDLKLAYSTLRYPIEGLKVNKISSEDKIKVENYNVAIKASQIKLQIVKRVSTERDIEYWAQYGISRETLNYYHVTPVLELYRNGECIYRYISLDSEYDPCFAYYFPRSKHIKCYFPYRKDRRFLGNISNLTDIQGYDQCDIKGPSRLLVLTKSMKDCMLLHEFGIDAIAIHGETQKFSPDFIRHIKKYYPRIVSLYDRDPSGFLGARYLWKEYRIAPFFIPKRTECKDISDLYKKHGREVAEKMIHVISAKPDVYECIEKDSSIRLS